MKGAEGGDERRKRKMGREKIGGGGRATPPRSLVGGEDMMTQVLLWDRRTYTYICRYSLQVGSWTTKEHKGLHPSLSEKTGL